MKFDANAHQQSHIATQSDILAIHTDIIVPKQSEFFDSDTKPAFSQSSPNLKNNIKPKKKNRGSPSRPNSTSPLKNKSKSPSTSKNEKHQSVTYQVHVANVPSEKLIPISQGIFHEKTKKKQN